MLVGYARTSTTDQEAGLEAQLRDLKAAGCEKTFHEQVSSVGVRAELERCIDYVRDTDQLVCKRLDRFARSMADAVDLERRIAAKGATLKILDPPVDTSTAAGRLTFNIFSSVAQFEREIMLERQREGIAAAKAKGLYKGRKPTVRNQEVEIRRLKADGLSNGAIARQLKVHRSNVGRVLAMGSCRPDAEAGSPASDT
jgi:DNA invertase Pin-like site-specific DNA recombinase